MSDGSVKHLHVLARALETSSGNLEYVSAVTDVTERKRAEEERERLRADLSRVNRVSMLGELAASVSHELKPPIAAPMTNARTCMRWLKRDQIPTAYAAMRTFVQTRPADWVRNSITRRTVCSSPVIAIASP